VLEDIQIDFNKDAGLCLVLTNRVAFWPGTKSFAVSDPITTEHLSLSKIELFSYRAKSKLVSVGTGGLLVLLGLFMTFGEYFETGAILVGLPQALLVAGIVIALTGGRRKRLVLRGPSAKLKSSAPISDGSRSGSVNRANSPVSPRAPVWSISGVPCAQVSMGALSVRRSNSEATSEPPKRSCWMLILATKISDTTDL